MLYEVITQKYDFGILTEETPDNGSRLVKDYFWCVDPLDGTLPFTEGTPGYSVSIALVSKSGRITSYNVCDTKLLRILIMYLFFSGYEYINFCIIFDCLNNLMQKSKQ